MKSEKFEIVVPVWAGKSGYQYFGDADYNSCTSEIASAHISLRAIREGDKYPYFLDAVRAINNLSLYVWFTHDDCISIDLRHNGDRSATMTEAEANLKAFKKYRAKALKGYPMLNNFHRGTTNLHTELTLVLLALGVKRSVEYHGIGVDETYQPIALAVKSIADILEVAKGRLQKRQSA